MEHNHKEQKYLDEKGRVLQVLFDPYEGRFGTFCKLPRARGFARMRSKALPFSKTKEEAQGLLDQYATTLMLQTIPSLITLESCLLLVMDSPPSQEHMKQWTDLERAEVATWAVKTHLRASDNPVRVPPVPQVIFNLQRERAA
ncbi:MAG: hypothetical protein AAGU11_03035 [Syntrophobacteraceae bacterium]